MKNFLKIAALAFVALSLIALVFLFILVRSTGSTVASGRAQIQSSGDKVLFTDYAEPPIPEEENAYHYLMQLKPYSDAFEKELLANPEFESAEYSIPAGRQISPSFLKSLEKGIDDTAAGFDLLKKAADAPGFRSQINHSMGYAVELKHINLLRSAGRMLATRAIVLASRDQGDESLRVCIDGLKLQRLVSSEPMLVQWLVAISVQNQMFDAAHHVLVSASTSEAARAELDAVLASIDNEAGLVDALKAERAVGLLTFDQIREGTAGEGVTGTPLPSFLSSSWIGQAYLNDDEAAYTRIMNQLIELVGKSRTERKLIEEELTAELSEKGFRRVVTKLTIPALAQVARAQEFADTKRRCLRIALRVHGKQEFDLESIPADIRTDPISRKPLEIQKQPEGWLIYGVGDNEKDDGGDFTKDPMTNKPLDAGYLPALVPALVPAEPE